MVPAGVDAVYVDDPDNKELVTSTKCISASGYYSDTLTISSNALNLRSLEESRLLSIRKRIHNQLRPQFEPSPRTLPPRRHLTLAVRRPLLLLTQQQYYHFPTSSLTSITPTDISRVSRSLSRPSFQQLRLLPANSSSDLFLMSSIAARLTTLAD